MTESADGPGAGTGYWRATWVAVLCTCAMIATAVVSTPLSAHAAQLLASVLGLFGAGWVCARHYGLRIESWRPTLPGTVVALFFGASLGVFGTGAASLVGEATESLFTGTAFGDSLQRVAEARQESLRHLLFLGRPTMIPVVLLVIAVGPAICEEFVYRGVVPAALREPRRMPRILFVGFLFALMHIDPFAFLPLLVVGAGLQWYAERSAGWTSAAVAHFALNSFNGVVFVRLYGIEPPPVGLSAVMALSGLGLAAIALKLARR